MNVVDDGAITWLNQGYWSTNAAYSPAWEELARIMDRRRDFIGMERGPLPLLRPNPEGEPVSLVGLVSTAATPGWIRDILTTIAVHVETMQRDPQWCDADGTPYSGFNLVVPDMTEWWRFKQVCEDIKRSLDEHRYRQWSSGDPIPGALNCLGGLTISQGKRMWPNQVIGWDGITGDPWYTYMNMGEGWQGSVGFFSMHYTVTKYSPSSYPCTLDLAGTPYWISMWFDRRTLVGVPNEVPISAVFAFHGEVNTPAEGCLVTMDYEPSLVLESKTVTCSGDTSANFPLGPIPGQPPYIVGYSGVMLGTASRTPYRSPVNLASAKAECDRIGGFTVVRTLLGGLLDDFVVT